MAEIVIYANIVELNKEVGRRSSLATQSDPFYAAMNTEQKQSSQLHSLTDRIVFDFVNDAAKEILKLFISRAGDATVSYIDASQSTLQFIFTEGYPSLSAGHTASIVKRLTANVKYAFVHFILKSLYGIDGNLNKFNEHTVEFENVSQEILGDLYRLHD